jgi:hypothetical protein
MKTHPGLIILKATIDDTVERRKLVAALVRLNKNGLDVTEYQVATALTNVSLSGEGLRLVAEFINSI